MHSMFRPHCLGATSLQHSQAAVARCAALQQQQQQQRWGRCTQAVSAAAPGSSSSQDRHYQQPCSQLFMQCDTWQHQQQSGMHRQGVLCFASKSGSSSGSRSKGPPADINNNMDDMEDVILVDDSDSEEDEWALQEEDGFVDFSEDEDVEDDEGADFEGEEGFLGIGSDEDPGPEVLTGNVEWGDKALQLAEEVLDRPENKNLSLYLFRVLVPTKTIEVRLDKLDDPYGSPGLEDIERFSRALAQALEAQLGAEAAGEISFEVSSPGAERTLILPQDLLRFKELPMRVEYMSEVGVLQNLVLRFLELDELNGKSTWELADVKANQNVKGRGLSKKQRLQKYDIPLEALERVRIYVDF